MATDPLRRAGEPPPEWAAGARVAGYFERHGRMVYGLCRTLLRDPAEAEDASQTTFVSAYRALLSGADVRDPAAWLATIARNECHTRARLRMREPLALQESDGAHAAHGPEEELDRRYVAGEIRDAIAELPDKQREAVVLRDLYGMRYDEVGSALGLSRASVESLLFRARRQLRVRLKPIAGGAIVVPLAVREGIAQALPGFAAAGSGGGMLAAGAAGAGGGGLLAGLANLSSAPIVAKVAVATVALGTAGSATLAGSDPPAQANVARPPAKVAALADPAKMLALATARRPSSAAHTGARAHAGGSAESGESRERVGSEDRGPGREQGGERPSRAESSGPTGSESGDGHPGHEMRGQASEERDTETQEGRSASSHAQDAGGQAPDAGGGGDSADVRSDEAEHAQGTQPAQSVPASAASSVRPGAADEAPPVAASADPAASPEGERAAPEPAEPADGAPHD